MGELMDSSHVPFNFPTRPYVSQEWRNLTFIHWKVDEKLLRKHVPKELEVDKYNGDCYVGLVPFVMKNVRPKGLFSVPGISTFWRIQHPNICHQRRHSRGLFPDIGSQESNHLHVCTKEPMVYLIAMPTKLKHVGNYIMDFRAKKNSYKASGKTTYSENVVDFEKESLEYFCLKDTPYTS